MRKVARRSNFITYCSLSESVDCANEASLSGKQTEHLVHSQTNLTRTCTNPRFKLSVLMTKDATVLRIVGRGITECCDWWRDQVAGQDGLGLFDVRLIGDASIPQLSHQ